MEVDPQRDFDASLPLRSLHPTSRSNNILKATSQVLPSPPLVGCLAPGNELLIALAQAAVPADMKGDSQMRWSLACLLAGTRPHKRPAYVESWSYRTWQS